LKVKFLGRDRAGSKSCPSTDFCRILGERAENLEQAIACYQEALKVRTFDAFLVDWAATQNNLANAYCDRILGERAENLEQAIACYQEALKVHIPDAFPQQWAMTQNNLGIAYYNRIRGERAENLEQAIACYQEALKVRTFDAFLVDWAATQNNLAAAYYNRILGERADNLETAIACYQEALKVRTFDAFPVDWAMTQNNLGRAYYNRILGERAENLETAIACYEESLKVCTPDAFPNEWATTQNNLATAYCERIRGERADNLETAIACYEESLKVYIPDAFPNEWATMQNNLATAYCERIRGERADNLETAIACYRDALKVRTFDAFPVDWAVTQNNLGVAYRSRILGERAENLEQAIACYQEALKVRTFDAFPVDWAVTQNNLGVAYRSRILGERAENLETAIACYQEALKVRTFDAFPQDWAATQNNLAAAYYNRILGERADNLETAIACYQEALKICTPDAFPLECLSTASNLGDLVFREENWQLAIEAYKKAIEAVELSRSWAMTPQSKQEVMEGAIEVYYKIVQVYVNTERIPLALEYVERSKTRNLVELLATRDLKPRGEFSPAILEELDRLRHEIRTEEISLANQERIYDTLSRLGQPSQPSRPDRTHLNKLQQKLDELIQRDISPIDPTFSLTQKVEPIPFSDIQSLIDERTAIVEWYITEDKILAFIITSGEGSGITVWQSSPEDLKALLKRTYGYLRLYYRNDNKRWWRKQLESRLQNLAKILHLDEILTILSNVIPECDRLILIPHRFLHILPLHALPAESQKLKVKSQNFTYECLLDLFPRGVHYAPSCQLLKLAQSQERPDFRNLFAIQNPTEDLIYTDLEVEIINSFFPHPEVLARQNATEDAVKKYSNFSSVHCAHFSCHGEFNPESPLESALILADKEHWTLGEIFELSIPQCRLVTLSACETGFTDPSSLSDEYIGLPNGFLFAGSPSVVSSLWTVSDVSTAFLMVKFYEKLTAGDEGVSVGIALKQAQKWLRDLTIEELDRFLEQYKHQVEKTLAQWRPGQRLRYEESLKQIKQRQPHPFANPYYWAAFTATGV
jgi:CHAT domain-containing protein